jgi:hypothetical protein
MPPSPWNILTMGRQRLFARAPGPLGASAPDLSKERTSKARIAVRHAHAYA